MTDNVKILTILEGVFLKLGTADTDEDLEKCLGATLPHIIVNVSSPCEEIRTKVIEMLTHINKRVKSRRCVQLPVEKLLDQYQDPRASAFVINFTIIYIKLGFPRLTLEKQLELLPILVKAAECKQVQHRDSLLYIIMGTLTQAKIPSDDKSYLGLDKCSNVSKSLLDIIQNIILYPYGWKGEGQPPELSKETYNQLLSHLPDVTKGEHLETLKTTCLKLLTCGIYSEQKMFPLLAIASADSRALVFNAAEMNLRKIVGGLELDKTIIQPFYLVYLGGGDGDRHRGKASTRLRLKLLPYMTKSDYVPFPICIQVLFDSLYGENTNGKLAYQALNFCDQMVRRLTDQQLNQVAETILQSGLLQLARADWADPSLVRQSFGCVGRLVARCPTLASPELLERLFTVLIQERDVDVSTSLRDCLVTMAPAYSDQCDEDWLQSVVNTAIASRSAKARSAALHYLIAPTEKSTNIIYMLLLAADHMDDDVASEAKKALFGPNYKAKPGTSEVPLPKFDTLLALLLSKEASKPPNPRLHSQMVGYLRLCLASISLPEKASKPLEAASKKPITISAVEHPCDKSVLVADYLKSLHSSQPSLVPSYAQWLLTLIEKDVGVVLVNALVEILGCLPSIVRPLVETHIDKLMIHLGHTKEEIRRAIGQLVALGCRAEAAGTLMTDLMAGGGGLERCNGCAMAAGFLVARAAADGLDAKVLPAHANTLMNNLSSNQAVEVNGAVQSLALMARAGPLPLSVDEKESLVDTLINMIVQTKHSSKIKDYACVVLGNLSIGEDFPHKEKIVKYFLEHSNEIKEVELVLSVGEILVSSILGYTGINSVEPWTQVEKVSSTSKSLEQCDVIAKLVVAGLLDLSKKPHPNTRQSCCFWLLAVTKSCCHLGSVQSHLQDIQNAFMELLSDTSSLVQEAASRGLAIVYQSGAAAVDRSQLLNKLVDQLTSGKRSVNQVTSDTKLFEEGSLGKAPTGGNLTTYKELCSLASDLNKPDLIYKFMSLANHNAVWNSKKGAAFGVTTLVDLASSEMDAHLPKIIAKLYRYQYDPTPSIQQAMAGIWTAFTSHIPNVVEKYSTQIYLDLVSNVVSPQWRVRQSSCKGLSDFMRSPASVKAMFKDCLEQTAELWAQLFRVMDDVHEQTREAATSTTKTLSRICMRQCEKDTPERKLLVDKILPVIMQKGIKSNVSQVRNVSASALSDLVKVGVLGDQVVELVPALLIATQELESSTLSHLSVMVSGSQADQEVVDSVRASAIKSHFTVQTLTRCVEYVKPEMLETLSPKLTDLLKTGGMGTRLATCHFLSILAHALPKDVVEQYTGKWLPALFGGLSDRNSAVRKQYASTIGQLAKFSKAASQFRLLIKLRDMYFEKEDDTFHLTVALTLQATLSQCQEVVRQNADVVLPFTFFAKHIIREKDGSNSTAIEMWEDICEDIGGTSAIMLHSAKVSDLLIESLQSPSWRVKAQAARSITTLSTKGGSDLDFFVREKLTDAVIAALSGRTWDQKHYLLRALASLASPVLVTMKNTGTIQRILQTLERECNRGRANYRMEALKALGASLSSLGIDKFASVRKIVSDLTVREKDDEDDDELASNELMEVAYDTLSKSWPTDKPASDVSWQSVVTECVDRLDKVVRAAQPAVLTVVVRVVQSLPPEETPAIVQLTLPAIDYSLGVSKHTNMRKTGLNLLLALLERTKKAFPADYIKIVEIYKKHQDELEKDISSEVRSRLSDMKEAQLI